MRTIAALFVRKDSIYKKLPGMDCYDAERDARSYQGPHPVICHPPCRAWGTLRKLAKAPEDEKTLALFAVECVRKYGGILEHPAYSTLWKTAGLPRPGKTSDNHGGFTIDIDQFWFGHRAQKRTWLYICGCGRSDVPTFAYLLGQAPRVVTNRHGLRSGSPGYRKEITKAEREATPRDFALFLVEIAQRCNRTTP